MNGTTDSASQERNHRGPWWLLCLLFLGWLIVFLIGSFGDSRLSSPAASATLEGWSSPTKTNESSVSCQCSDGGECFCDQTITRRFRTVVEPGQHPPTESELLCGTAGLKLVRPEPKEPKRPEDKDPLDRLMGWRVLQVVVSWTWTNLLILCLLSALIGELAAPAPTEFTHAMSRAFFIFLFTISGQLLFAGEMQYDISGPSSYFRLATLTSILGFLVGFHPDFFISAVDRFARAATVSGGANSAAAKVEVVAAVAAAKVSVSPTEPPKPEIEESSKS